MNPLTDPMLFGRNDTLKRWTDQMQRNESPRSIGMGSGVPIVVSERVPEDEIWFADGKGHVTRFKLSTAAPSPSAQDDGSVTHGN